MSDAVHRDARPLRLNPTNRGRRGPGVNHHQQSGQLNRSLGVGRASEVGRLRYGYECDDSVLLPLITRVSQLADTEPAEHNANYEGSDEPQSNRPSGHEPIRSGGARLRRLATLLVQVDHCMLRFMGVSLESLYTCASPPPYSHPYSQDHPLTPTPLDISRLADQRADTSPAARDLLLIPRPPRPG